MNYLKKLEEFNNTFKVKYNEIPTLTSKESGLFRVSLIEEELKELKEAIETADYNGIVDALCDLQYVLSGTVLHYGLKDEFDTCFDEVHQSNLSKVCYTKEDAEKTVRNYKGVSISAYIEEVGDKFLIKNKETGKVLKGIHFKNPDFTNLQKYLPSFGNPFIIGIVGKKGSGKSSLASKFRDAGYKEMQIAYPIKKIVASLLGCDISKLEDRAFKETPLSKFNGLTPRELLQQVGTEIFQEKLGSTVWIDLLMEKIKKSNYGKIVISDIRFQHCIDKIKAAGGYIIKLEGGDDNDSHISESGIDSLKGIDQVLAEDTVSDIIDPRENYDFEVHRQVIESTQVFKKELGTLDNIDLELKDSDVDFYTECESDFNELREAVEQIIKFKKYHGKR